MFSWEDSKTKKISGFDAAIAQALARYIIGGEDARSLLEVQQVTSDTRETVLTNGTVNAVVATYTITPERAEKIDFAGPYYASSQAILVKADNKDITGVDSLTGDVAVQSNSSSASALKKHAPNATAKPFDTQAKCVAAVESGQVKAYVVDQSLLKSEVLSNDKVKIVGDTFAEDPTASDCPRTPVPRPSSTPSCRRSRRMVHGRGSGTRRSVSRSAVTRLSHRPSARFRDHQPQARRVLTGPAALSRLQPLRKAPSRRPTRAARRPRRSPEPSS